jgi:probable F420-dependent oxidoreductase
MFVIGATVVAIRNGRPATAVPSAHPAAPRSRVVTALQPAATSNVDATTHQVRRSFGAIGPVWRCDPMRRRVRPLGTVGRMKVDGVLAGSITSAGEQAAELEAAGYAGAWTAETAHDPFLPLAVAAKATSEIELGTSIAVAFARNPMLLANIGWDLQTLSQGRFVLGLGSQIKPHITKRFSMEWSHPAARMREMIQAIRAIWDTWLNGTPLQFRGDFYRHTLMTPFFTPDASDLGDLGLPKIFLAGVGELMTEVAGEVCDGFLCHGFTTEKYLREVTIPALRRGRDKAGKTMDDFEVVGPSFVVTGATDEDMAMAVAGTRQQIAFYGSTPAYRGVLEIHGWGGLQDELNALSKQGKWAEMGELVDDEILNTFAVVAAPEDVAPELGRRYADVISRISFYAPYQSDPERWKAVMTGITAI